MKAIIAAAGYWTRMLPITKCVPKELLPVGEKPVIQYIVEGIVSANIKDIIIITSVWKESIENYFDKNYELENLLKRKWKQQLLEKINKPKELANYCFVKQKKQLWFAHAILYAEPWIDDNYFMLTVWDEIFDPRIYQDMVKLYKKHKTSIIWLQQIDIEKISSYWVVKLKNNEIVDLVEKPEPSKAPSNLRMIWIYILPKTIFSVIKKQSIDPKSWEYLLPDSIKELIKQWEKIIPYETVYKTYDVGNYENWLKANIQMTKFTI